MYRAIMNRLLRKEEGQSLIVVALALVALLGVAALAVDGGYAYAQRRRMQNAADMAAVAATRALGLGRSAAEVEQEIDHYARANGADNFTYFFVNGNGQPTGLLDDARGVHVQAQVTFNTFLGGVVGVRQMTAAAESEAEMYGVGGASNLLPILVHEDDFQYYQVYELWDDDHEAPGAFGWADWDDNGGASALASDIANPSHSGYWEIGDLVPAETGVTASSQIRNALNLWRNRNVTVPLYDQVAGTGNNTRYRISGFGEFVLVNYVLTSSDKRIWGYFIRQVTPGPPGGPDFGLQGIRLTR